MALPTQVIDLNEGWVFKGCEEGRLGLESGKAVGIHPVAAKNLDHDLAVGVNLLRQPHDAQGPFFQNFLQHAPSQAASRLESTSVKEMLPLAG